MKQLEIAARQGDYHRPFAKILLALAALREKQADLARTELEDLVHEFPENPLFARELAMRRKLLLTSILSAQLEFIPGPSEAEFDQTNKSEGRTTSS